MLIGNRRDRHPDLVDIGITKHLVQGHRAATAPAPDGDALRIDKWPTLYYASSGGLFLGSQHSDLSIDDFAPDATSRCGRAAIVKAHHQISLLRQHLVPEITG